jgi:hypothetical protein
MHIKTPMRHPAPNVPPMTAPAILDLLLELLTVELGGPIAKVTN